MPDVRWVAVLGVVAALLPGGCELTPGDEFTPVMSVHGVVWRGRNEPEGTPVFLNRTYGINETPASLLHGAEVLVVRRDELLGRDTLRFQEGYYSWYRHGIPHDPESAYACPGTFELLAGDTVWLRAAHPDFDTLYARTVVPDTFWIVYPRAGDTVTARDSLVFRRSRGARGYLISFAAQFQGDTFLGSLVIPQESIRGVPYDTLHERIPLVWLNYITPGPQTLRVMAMDSNYYVWMTGQGRGPRGRSRFLSAGVENGVGVFGSGSETEVRVFVRRDSADAGPRCRGYRPGSLRLNSR